MLTDLGYLLLATFPWMRGIYRRWAPWWYARLAAGYDRYVLEHAGYLDALTALLARLPVSPRIIVDLGAGTGAATRVLRRTFPEAVVIAVDASAAMLAPLRPPGGNVRTVIGDVFALPLRSATADLLVAHNAPFDPQEMGRVATPQGWGAVVLSSGGRIPRALRRWLLRTLDAAGWTCVEESRAGSGIALAFRRGPTRRDPF